MPHDLVAWAESSAKSGYVATTGVTDTRYGTSGDTQKLRAIASPTLSAMWQASVTAAKSEAFQIRSDRMSVNPTCGAGQVRDGVDPVLMSLPLKAQDVFTGYHDNGNTNEISGGVVAISYGGSGPIYSPIPIKPCKYVIGIDSTTDTAGTLPAGWVTAVTTSWTGLEQDKRYEIIGIGGWGTLDIACRLASTTDLGAGFKPGVPLGATAVEARMTYLSEPFPFMGSSPPDLEIQSIGASAEHHLTVLIA